jgi:hypothetical protein
MADRRDRIILSFGGGRRLIRQPLPRRYRRLSD